MNKFQRFILRVYDIPFEEDDVWTRRDTMFSILLTLIGALFIAMAGPLAIAVVLVIAHLVEVLLK
jgi:hypothetical protein